MQSKCDALKSEGMNLITQQNAASVTLADLKLRLSDLVDELATIYNISNDVLEVSANPNHFIPKSRPKLKENKLF